MARAGGSLATRALYSYSLGIALFTLFAASFVLHWLASTAAANEEATLHGWATRTALEYLADAQLWFESFQNWQSEFLSTAVLVALTIFLRFRFSPESKLCGIAAHSDWTVTLQRKVGCQVGRGMITAVEPRHRPYWIGDLH